jgi:hypothetical protein
MTRIKLQHVLIHNMISIPASDLWNARMSTIIQAQSPELYTLPPLPTSFLRHQQPRHRPNIQRPQITIMLPGPQKDHRNPRRMHHTHQRAHHIAHSITLANDKPIQLPTRAKTGVEIARLRDGIGAHQRLAHHEDFIGVCELGELFETGHEALVIVPAAGGVDENDVEAVFLRVRDSVGCDVCRVLAVALFEEVDFASFSFAEFLQVLDVHAQLLDGAGAEGVGGGDEDAVVVLQEEEGDFGEVCGFADAVDADDGEDIGAWGGAVCVGDFAEEVEGGRGGEDFGEGFFHRGAEGCFDCFSQCQWVGRER